MTWEAFCDLDVDAQAGYIAEYEAEQTIEGIAAEQRRKAFRKKRH